jgi:hypothetical protein
LQDVTFVINRSDMTDIDGEHREQGGDGGDADRAADVGRRRREFIRAHHPDRGGDTESFIAGLRGFDDGPDPADGDPLPRVTVVARQPWAARLARAAVQRLRDGKPPARVR